MINISDAEKYFKSRRLLYFPILITNFVYGLMLFILYKFLLADLEAEGEALIEDEVMMIFAIFALVFTIAMPLVATVIKRLLLNPKRIRNVLNFKIVSSLIKPDAPLSQKISFHYIFSSFIAGALCETVSVMGFLLGALAIFFNNLGNNIHYSIIFIVIGFVLKLLFIPKWDEVKELIQNPDLHK